MPLCRRIGPISREFWLCRMRVCRAYLVRRIVYRAGRDMLVNVHGAVDFVLEA